jgi:hypothetical protein
MSHATFFDVEAHIALVRMELFRFRPSPMGREQSSTSESKHSASDHYRDGKILLRGHFSTRT